MKKKINNFFNNPKYIIIFLIFLLLISVLMIYKLSMSSKIYIASLKKDNISISNLHMFINNDINMFYSTPAIYTSDDEKIYGIEAGYYVKVNNNYVSLLTQESEFEDKESLIDTLEFYSAFNKIESNSNKTIFTNEIKDNIENNLYFLVKVKKEKNSSLETIIEEKIELKKLTK